MTGESVEQAAALPGVVQLQRRGGSLAMPIEVHVETEDAYEGYNLANPFAGYLTYPKAQFVVVKDERRKR